MRLFPNWPQWLADFLVDDEPKLDCRCIVYVVVDGFKLNNVAEALNILLVVINQSLPVRSLFNDVAVGDGPTSGQ